MLDESRLRSKIKADRFYEELERLLKRYNPEVFAPIVATFIYQLFDKPDRWRFFPVHHLIHSIEANCAYSRSYINDPLTENRIRLFVNHYNSYYDPFIQYELTEKKSLHFALLAMSKQQFALQRHPSIIDLSRSLLLFVENNALPNISPLFLDTYKFSLHDWVYMCFAIHAFTYDRQPPLSNAGNYLNSEIKSLPKRAVEPFLQLSSITPEEVGKNFKRIREKHPTYLHIFLQSVFFTYPLLSFSNGNYLCIHPYLMIYHASEGLYRVCHSLNSELFYHEFSKSFERYVGRVLQEQSGILNIWNESEILKISPGKVCDYVINLQDCVLLVECKASRYSSTLFTEKAVAQDNYTHKVADAFEQLYFTACRIKNGEIDTILGGHEKPIVGICVTYGDFEFANSPWQFETFYKPLMSEDIFADNGWTTIFDTTPQVLSIDNLERFISIVFGKYFTPLTLARDKLSERYEVVGDWSAYLSKFSDKMENLPILDAASERFFSKFTPRTSS